MTKVFGIGLSRTGTSSLHVATVLLGYPAIHYPSALAQAWAAGNFSADLADQFDVFTDLPTPFYFAELDQAFADARFILTRRDPGSWLLSMEAHYRRSPPPSAATKERDRIRMLVYGTVDFDRRRLADVYRCHEETVLRHFRSRPRDLLVLDVADDDKWLRLCPFLDRPTPTFAYPQLSRPPTGEFSAVTAPELDARRAALLAMVTSARAPSAILHHALPIDDI